MDAGGSVRGIGNPGSKRSFAAPMPTAVSSKPRVAGKVPWTRNPAPSVPASQAVFRWRDHGQAAR